MSESTKIYAFPRPRLEPEAQPISTGAHKGLALVVTALINQFGPVGAHNELVKAANEIRADLEGINDR